MQRVRDIAEQNRVWPNLLLGKLKAQRIDRARSDARKTSESPAEFFL